MSGSRVHVVDPPAYTPPYDHALCTALAAAGAEVTLVTTEFAHGEVPPPSGYAVDRRFYAHRPRRDALRRWVRLAEHVPDMLAYARSADREADVVHFQWLSVQAIDALLLPRRRPLVLTAHDVLPREPRPGQKAGQKRLYDRVDAVVVHSQHGAERLREELGIDPGKVHVIPHGPLTDLAAEPPGAALPAELGDPGSAPVALCFGLMRPYKGIDVLLEAWREAQTTLPAGARLWIAGLPRMDISALRAAAPASVDWLPRFVSGAEAAAVWRRADLAVLPYRDIDQSGVLFTALGLRTPLLVTEVGGFPELAATGAAVAVAPGDASALARALSDLLADPARRQRLVDAGARATSQDGPFAWPSIAQRTLAVYEKVIATRSHAA